MAANILLFLKLAIFKRKKFRNLFFVSLGSLCFQLGNKYSQSQRGQNYWQIFVKNFFCEEMFFWYFRFLFLLRFLLGGKQLFARQILVHTLKKSSHTKEKRPTLPETKHLCILFFPHRTRPFHLWTETGRGY